MLSGVQPTGSIHLGNYLGAIRNWVALQETYDTFYCVVDLHAVTAPHEPKLLAEATRTVAALYLASGVDPQRSTVFVQSHVTAHSELAWLLNCVTPVGWLGKMIQFKEKARKQGEEVSMGLMDYPVLMAADILLYGADLVPVGEDQRQHLELTRDISGRFNALYGGKALKARKGLAPSGRARGGRVLKVPEALIPPQGARVMSLDDGSSKLSKSNPDEGSRINLLDSAAKIKRCKTDTLPALSFDDPQRPEAANLLTIYQLCSGQSRAAVKQQCSALLGPSSSRCRRRLWWSTCARCSSATGRSRASRFCWTRCCCAVQRLLRRLRSVRWRMCRTRWGICRGRAGCAEPGTLTNYCSLETKIEL